MNMVPYDQNGHGRQSGMVADAYVAVVGEQPYAEGREDKEDLSLARADVQMTENLRDKCQKLIVILVPGRPMIVTEPLQQWDALVAAWLPGTEGQGVVDVLFGDKPFTGKLPYTWPRSSDQLPFDFRNLSSGEAGPLFSQGYGLTYKAANDSRTWHSDASTSKHKSQCALGSSGFKMSRSIDATPMSVDHSQKTIDKNNAADGASLVALLKAISWGFDRFFGGRGDRHSRPVWPHYWQNLLQHLHQRLR
jgi:hypothetical protein